MVGDHGSIRWKFARIFRKHQDLYAQYIEVWVDKLLDVTEPYHQAALFPEGSKAEKHPDLVRKIDPGIRRLQFTLTPEQGRSFIFRPADRQVILRIQRISLEGSDDNENPVTYSHTADFIQDDVFFFALQSPHCSFTFLSMIERKTRILSL